MHSSGNPPIVILDEPVNGLDPQGITDIRKMIIDINKKENVTFIISSHILSELDLIATKFGFIDGGILLKELSHDELHKNTSTSSIIEIADTGKARQILKKSDLEYTIKNKETTLEEYFFKLVGGGKND